MTSTGHVVVDIGSTTTKAVLFREVDGAWTFVRREAPTTVEAPHADVKVGLVAALGALGEAAGIPLLDGDRPAIPLQITSSAGGGLAMVVTGLVKEVTSRSAERAALGAGAVVQDVVALNDGRPPYRKIEDLKRLRPDMILFAGGFDGDAVSGPVFLAELLRQAALRPKLSEEARLPVLYAGNRNARDIVRETLGDGYLFEAVPNIRPASDHENLEDARAAIHEIFMEHVMSHAPGYAELGAWVDAPILPTPSALGRILETVTAANDRRILVVDIGGATTDVFTAAGGEVFRTVSANLGMSYSALNVADAGGFATIREVLGDGVDPAEIWNRLGRKYLRPTCLPSTPEDVAVEWAVATAATRLAVSDHLCVLRGARLSRGEDSLSLRSFGRRKRRREAPRSPLPLEGYDLVIGSGGILSHSPREAAATILTNALEPRGPVDLAVDRAFVLPHLGALGRRDPDLARRLFDEVAVVRLGTLVAPVTKVKAPNGLLLLGGEGGDHEVPAESLSRVAPAGDGPVRLTLRARGLKLGRKEVVVDPGHLGVIVDTRVRPLSARDATLLTGPIIPPTDDRPALAPARRARRGTLRERRVLAVPGDVLVAPGDTVASDTLIARSALLFRRPFFLEVARAIEVEAGELEPFLLRRPGEDVVAGQEIAVRERGAMRSILRFSSPVAGTIERILPDGTMTVREAPDHAVPLRSIPFARDMGLPAPQALRWLLVEPGQEVEAGQMVARRGTGPQKQASVSPIRGRVRSIDREYGVVHVESLRRDLAVTAWLPGRIESVSDRGAVVVAEGLEIRGTWGRGTEAAGPLAVDRFSRGEIVTLTRHRPTALAEAEKAGVAALVLGGFDLGAIRAAAPDFPLILTEGFGAADIAPEIAALLAGHDGETALVDGTTELRVGVRRPRILLPSRPVSPGV